MHRESLDGRVARVVLVDDHDFIRASIRSVLSREPDIDIVGEASTGREGLDLCRRLRPELVLMDIEMPEMDGLEATRRIKETCSDTSVIVLTAYEEPEYLLRAIQAGAGGFVIKESALPKITGVVRSVLNGEPSLDPELSMRLLKEISAQPKPDGEEERRTAERRARIAEPLTDREMEILHLLALGYTNQRIAQELCLSVGTVKTHVHRVIQKLGVSDRTQAAVLALKLELVPAGQ